MSKSSKQSSTTNVSFFYYFRKHISYLSIFFKKILKILSYILVDSVYKQRSPMKEVSQRRIFIRSFKQQPRKYIILIINLSIKFYTKWNFTIIEKKTHIRNNNDESPKSGSDEEYSNENNAYNNVDNSNNNQLIKWTVEDLVTIEDSEEKIYEDLCYVTISSSLEVFMTFIP